MRDPILPVIKQSNIVPGYTVVDFFQKDKGGNFLANTFNASPINIVGDPNSPYQSTEHYFQVKKFNEPKYVNGILSCLEFSKLPTLSEELAARHNLKLGKLWHGEKDKMNGRKHSTMIEAVLAKIQQHPQILASISDLNDVIIREDSPTDSNWGVGPDKKGKNELGVVWMACIDAIHAKGGAAQVNTVTVNDVKNHLKKAHGRYQSFKTKFEAIPSSPRSTQNNSSSLNTNNQSENLVYDVINTSTNNNNCLLHSIGMGLVVNAKTGPYVDKLRGKEQTDFKLLFDQLPPDSKDFDSLSRLPNDELQNRLGDALRRVLAVKMREQKWKDKLIDGPPGESLGLAHDLARDLEKNDPNNSGKFTNAAFAQNNFAQVRAEINQMLNQLRSSNPAEAKKIEQNPSELAKLWLQHGGPDRKGGYELYINYITTPNAGEYTTLAEEAYLILQETLKINLAIGSTENKPLHLEQIDSQKAWIHLHHAPGHYSLLLPPQQFKEYNDTHAHKLEKSPRNTFTVSAGHSPVENLPKFLEDNAQTIASRLTNNEKLSKTEALGGYKISEPKSDNKDGYSIRLEKETKDEKGTVAKLSGSIARTQNPDGTINVSFTGCDNVKDNYYKFLAIAIVYYEEFKQGKAPGANISIILNKIEPKEDEEKCKQAFFDAGFSSVSLGNVNHKNPKHDPASVNANNTKTWKDTALSVGSGAANLALNLVEFSLGSAQAGVLVAGNPALAGILFIPNLLLNWMRRGDFKSFSTATQLGWGAGGLAAGLRNYGPTQVVQWVTKNPNSKIASAAESIKEVIPSTWIASINTFNKKALPYFKKVSESHNLIMKVPVLGTTINYIGSFAPTMMYTACLNRIKNIKIKGFPVADYIGRAYFYFSILNAETAAETLYPIMGLTLLTFSDITNYLAKKPQLMSQILPSGDFKSFNPDGLKKAIKSHGPSALWHSAKQHFGGLVTLGLGYVAYYTVPLLWPKKALTEKEMSTQITHLKNETDQLVKQTAETRLLTSNIQTLKLDTDALTRRTKMVKDFNHTLKEYAKTHNPELLKDLKQHYELLKDKPVPGAAKLEQELSTVLTDTARLSQETEQMRALTTGTANLQAQAEEISTFAADAETLLTDTAALTQKTQALTQFTEALKNYSNESNSTSTAQLKNTWTTLKQSVDFGSEFENSVAQILEDTSQLNNSTSQIQALTKKIQAMAEQSKELTVLTQELKNSTSGLKTLSQAVKTYARNPSQKSYDSLNQHVETIAPSGLIANLLKFGGNAASKLSTPAAGITLAAGALLLTLAKKGLSIVPCRRRANANNGMFRAATVPNPPALNSQENVLRENRRRMRRLAQNANPPGGAVPR